MKAPDELTKLQPETFQHAFGGYLFSQAYRRLNPGGSPGAIVAVDAVVDDAVFLPKSAVVWPGSRIGEGASIGEGARIGVEDWLFVAGPQGSRDAFATVTHSKAHGLRWWVGCQHGLTTEQLLARVEIDHGASAHGDDYRYLISVVEAHPGLAKHKAAIALGRGREEVK